MTDEPFQRFMRGEELSREGVARGLAGCALPGVPARLRYAPARKVMVFLEDGAHHPAGVVKMAFHPFSAALLRNEARGLVAARQHGQGMRPPDGTLLFDTGESAALLLAQVPGTPAPSWRALTPGPRPFAHQAPQRLPLAHHLEALAPALALGPDPRAWQQALAALTRRFGGETAALGPCHGDCIYWNLFPARDGPPWLLDWEYYTPLGATGFDAWFWRLSPLVRKATARGWEGLLLALLPQLIRSPAPGEPLPARAGAALMLAEHGARISRELATPDITTLFGDATVAWWHRLLQLYPRMMERLAAP